jgi:hypothetical protein
MIRELESTCKQISITGKKVTVPYPCSVLMMDAEYGKIVERLSPHGLDELSEVVGVWEARIEGIQNPPTKIKVVGGPKGFCIALPNYYPRNGGFHLRPQIGAQLALEDTN